LLGIVFSEPLTRIITPGFSPENQKITATLTRIMFLSPLLLGVSGIFGGILQSFKRFLIYSLSPIFYNLGIIVGALFFVEIWGLSGLAWGVVLGAFFHMVIQIPVIYQLGFRYQLKIFWHDVSTWSIWRMMLPRTMSLAISQINLVVITVIASGLKSGSLTVFSLANNLQSFPVGIFGISFAIAAFPTLAEAAFNKERLRVSFSQTMRQIFFFVVPATVFIIILRAQIVRVILGAGNFDWNSTILTMNTLGFFALSLFAQATIPLLVRVFYARHNSATPLYIGFLTVLVNIFLSFFLAPRLGVAGLALAFSLASILNFILLWLAIYFSIGNLDISNILRSVLKFTASAIVAGLVAQGMKQLVWPFIDMTRFSGVFIQLCASASAGLVVYLLLCYLLKSEELFGFLAALKTRWPFKRVKIDDQSEARGV
jgi:putative peptidoglycan lipid II flippase